MALAGNVGIALDATIAGDIPIHAWLFGEDQGRYLIATNKTELVLGAAKSAGVPANIIGVSGGNELSVADFTIPLVDIRDTYEGWMPNFMGMT